MTRILTISLNSFIKCCLSIFRIAFLLWITFKLIVLTLITRIFVGNRTNANILCNKILQKNIKTLLFVCGIRLHLRSKVDLSTISKTNTLIVANHTNYFDPLIIGMLTHSNWLGKAELKNMPFFGLLLRLTGILFVKRSSLSSRLIILHKLIKNLNFQNYCIFPEGTTTVKDIPDKRLWLAGSFYAAQKTGSRIVCVGLHYENHEQTAWVDDMSLMPHLFETFKRRKINVWVSCDELDIQNISSRELSKNALSKVTNLCVTASNKFL